MSHAPPGQERILWTDRICIRQIDKNEENPQVAQMADIYKKAQRVLVWLGEPAHHLGETDVARNLGTSRRLLDVADTVSGLAKNAGPRFDPRGTEGLPPASDTIWTVFSDIVRKDWYKRIWTLQEAVLARELTVHYGAHVLAWDDV
ncbi:heterokaryon incompatibility, partial [Lasiosphaeria miniovina]